MPTATDLVNTRGRLRTFLQLGGTSPLNTPYYTGVNSADIEITSVTAPKRGSIEPVNQHDPLRRGLYKTVARTVSAPDLPTYSYMIRELVTGIPKQFGTMFDCPLTTYELAGYCKQPDDFVAGWEGGYMLIYPNAVATSIDHGDRKAFDADDPLVTTAEATLRENPYVIGAVTFSSSGQTFTLVPQNDITYAPIYSCPDCGLDNDGSKFIYGAGNAGAAAPPLVTYSVNGGSTWAQASITTAANAEAIVAIEVVGRYLVALSATATSATQGGYYWAELNPVTGVPGTFTKVLTGFVNNKQPRDMTVVGNTLFIVGDGGYIYTTSDIPSGVTVQNAGTTTTVNLLRVHYGPDTNTIVATGATSTVIKTTNNGQNWGATLTSPTAGAHNIGAVAVKTPYEYWVGTTSGANTGKLFFTLNGGETWTEKTFDGSGAGQVLDIVWATPEQGWFSHSTAAPVARLFSLFAGGSIVSNTGPRVQSLATTEDQFTRLAVPLAAISTIRANTLAIAGLAGNGADGIIYTGRGSYV